MRSAPHRIAVPLVTGAPDFALARFLPDGTVDPGFGTAGRAVTAVVGGEGRGDVDRARNDRRDHHEHRRRRGAPWSAQGEARSCWLVLGRGALDDQAVLVRYDP